jgi:predicted transcriptional regulator
MAFQHGRRHDILKVMKNFHLPLPEDAYNRLRSAAEQSQMPATVLAREAIESWLRQRARKSRHDAIAAYAAEVAGTALDLDRELESAGVDHLRKPARKRR